MRLCDATDCQGFFQEKFAELSQKILWGFLRNTANVSLQNAIFRFFFTKFRRLFQKILYCFPSEFRFFSEIVAWIGVSILSGITQCFQEFSQTVIRKFLRQILNRFKTSSKGFSISSFKYCFEFIQTFLRGFSHMCFFFFFQRFPHQFMQKLLKNQYLRTSIKNFRKFSCETYKRLSSSRYYLKDFFKPF